MSVQLDFSDIPEMETQSDTQPDTSPSTERPAIDGLPFDPETISAAAEDYQRPAVLEYYHNERGYAAERIAREVFDGDVTGETIRNWLDKHGLKPETGTLASAKSHTDLEPLVLLGVLARRNGDSMLETPLETLLERYGDRLSRSSVLEADA